MDPIPSWLESFEPFSWVHAIAFLAVASSIAGACFLGRRFLVRSNAEVELRFVRAWSGFAIAVNLWAVIYWQLPAQFDPRVSLPVQPCDLAGLVAPVALLSAWRWSHSMLFFWGIALSSIGLVLPATLQEGPAHVNFYLYWLVHLVIVGSALYLAIVRRYRPTVRDLGAMLALTLIYGILMAFLNEALDANYAFIGRNPGGALADLDSVAPWPDRAYVAGAIVACLFSALWFATRARKVVA